MIAPVEDNEQQETSSPKPYSSPSQLSPGKQLAEERKKQGLTERQVADQLKITLSKLSALENDQYDKFPAQIYLKGYLKNYARLLRMPEQNISDSYKAFYKDIEIEEAPVPATEPNNEAKSHSLGFIVIGVIALIVLMIVLIPLMGSSLDDDQQAAISNQQTSLTDAIVVESTDKETRVSPLEVSDETTPAELMPQQSTEMVDAKPIEILASKVTAAELISLVEPKKPITALVDEAVPPVDVLAFQFTNQCWIEVRDNTGRLLYSGLENAGSEREVEGEGPFQIVIGNVIGTELSLNGESIILNSPVNGRPLRLEIGS